MQATFDNFQSTLSNFVKPTITVPTKEIPAISVIPDTPAGKLFLEMPNDHPNYRVFEQVCSGNFDREVILREYKPLGLTAKLEGSRGLPDMAAKRKLNLGQFFTPQNVVKALTRATALDLASNCTICDWACGTGNLLQYVYGNNKVFGVEIEEHAYAIAKELWPEAVIVNDNMLNQFQMKGCVDAALINPPFSLLLEQRNIKLENAGWGKLGARSSIESHLAALEIAITKADLIVGAIVPTSFFTNEKTYAFEKWVNTKSPMRKMLRIDLPAEAFEVYGTSWNCSIVVYAVPWYKYDGDCKHYAPATMADLEGVLEEWFKTSAYDHLKTWVIDRSEYNAAPRYSTPTFEFIEHEEVSETTTVNPRLPLEFKNTIKVSVNANGSGLRYKPSDLLTSLLLHSLVLDSGTIQGSFNLDTKLNWNWDQRLASIMLEKCRSTPEQYIQKLRDMGIQVDVDPGVVRWLAKKRRHTELNLTPFENVQLDENTNEWITLHEDDGLRTVYSDLYLTQAKKLVKAGVNWLWDYQADDVVRMSMKKSNLYAAGMGLGKTRVIIALGILYGCKHNLIIVEPKLTNEFLKEFIKLGITDVQIINKKQDVYTVVGGRKKSTLKQFNIISYRKIWSPLDNKTNITFAKVLKKQCNYIALDEAHKIAGKDTNQGKTARDICHKAKHVLLCTGTPVGNYPRNIYALLVAGWGDGTQLNEYGYVHPMKSGWCLTPGTRHFSETFIKIEWVTEQFAQTLSTGAKAREIPVVKDIEKWREIISPKMIRRRKTEPEVAKHMPDLKPVFKTHAVMPDMDHIKYYKYWLQHFADWFKEQLRLRGLDSSHNINMAIVLAHLTKLDLASTIPQRPDTDKAADAPTWSHGMTKKQEKVAELVKEAVENGEKVIVFSGRPYFQAYMQRQLEKEGIHGYTFTGEQTPANRVVILDDFKANPEISVLFSTTTCGDTGLNIPEASTVIFADTNWTPSKTQQAYSRILRPDQEKEPHIHFVYNLGMLDEYMRQLCEMKEEGINQAIDGHDAEEFDPETWMSYTDFSYKMLKELNML